MTSLFGLSCKTWITPYRFNYLLLSGYHGWNCKTSKFYQWIYCTVSENLGNILLNTLKSSSLLDAPTVLVEHVKMYYGTYRINRVSRHEANQLERPTGQINLSNIQVKSTRETYRSNQLKRHWKNPLEGPTVQVKLTWLTDRQNQHMTCRSNQLVNLAGPINLRGLHVKSTRGEAPNKS